MVFRKNMEKDQLLDDLLLYINEHEEKLRAVRYERTALEECLTTGG